MSQSLERGIDILELLATRRMHLGEIAESLSVHKSTALRLLRVLEEHRLVRHNNSHEYRLGPGLFSIASESLGSLDIRGVVSPTLRRLSEETKLTVHLAALDGSEVIYLDKYESPGTVRMYSKIGAHAPLHCTGVAKAILAYLPEDRQEQLISSITFTKYTDQTITGPAVFRKQLKEIKNRGYSIDNREHEDFVHCVAVPIVSFPQEVKYSISLTAPVFTTEWEELKAHIPLLQSAARSIADELA